MRRWVSGRARPLDGLAERLRDDDLALAVLTDEELAAIDQPLHPDGPVGWYATLEDHEELLDQDVLHACTLRSPARAIGGLVARCDPGEVAGDHAGDPIGGQDADEEVHALADDLLRRASVRTELITIGRDGRAATSPQLVHAATTIVAVDGALWGIATRPAPSGGPGPTVVVQLSAGELAATVAGVLDPLVVTDAD